MSGRPTFSVSGYTPNSRKNPATDETGRVCGEIRTTPFCGKKQTSEGKRCAEILEDNLYNTDKATCFVVGNGESHLIGYYSN